MAGRAGMGGDEKLFGGTDFAERRGLRRAAGRVRLLTRSMVGQPASCTPRDEEGGLGRHPAQTRWGKWPDALTRAGAMLDVYQTARPV